jgi:hypothetical protein
VPYRRLVLSLCLIGCMLASGGAARGGGSIRGYVLLPDRGRVVFVDVDAARVAGSVAVPRGSGPLAASIDGSRVLVANTRLGLVTEVDGIRARRVRTFTGLGQPVAVVLVPRPEAGLVRPRYAAVADARGWIDMLDLVAGRVVRRVAVAQPSALALENARLWVASAGATTLKQFNLDDPARPRLVGRARTGILAAALAPFETSSATGVDVVSPSGPLVRVDGYSLVSTVVRRLAGRFTQLLAGYDGVIWAAESGGRVRGIRAGDGIILHGMRVPRSSQLLIVGGWLAAVHDRTLRMFALGTHERPRAIALPGAATTVAFAVLP